MQFLCRKTGNSWPFFRVSRANWAHICVFGHEDSFDCPVWGQRAAEDADPHSRKAWSNACSQLASCEACRNALGCPRENRKNGYESQRLRLVGCFGACCMAGGGEEVAACCMVGKGATCCVAGYTGRNLREDGCHEKGPPREERSTARRAVHGKAGGLRQEGGILR